MRILLDEQLPRQLAPHLQGHNVQTVQQQGWAGLKNGELLKQAAQAGFAVFLTSDQNIEFQQKPQEGGVVRRAPGSSHEQARRLTASGSVRSRGAQGLHDRQADPHWGLSVVQEHASDAVSRLLSIPSV